MPSTLSPLIESLRRTLAESPSSGVHPVRTFFAPGRVNLLGAHQDYNGGFVLPCAVDCGTYVAARARDDQRVRLHSVDRVPLVEIDLRALPQAAAEHWGWGNYAIGTLRALRRAGVELTGMDLLIGGDLPIGAGLSSSASLGIAIGLASCSIAQQDLEPQVLADCIRKGENEFVGVHSGILDPYACLLTQADHALFIDCLEQRIEHLPFPSESVTIAVCDTGLRRSLTDGRFNERVEECRSALRRLQTRWPELRALRDLSARQWEAGRDLLSAAEAKRALHVVEETPRCRRGADALRRGDLRELGRMIDASHESCRTTYEVSCPELDWIAARGRDLPFVFGTRLTGAGFGGCTVALIEPGSEDEYRTAIEGPYRSRFQRPATLHFFGAGGGAHELE